MAPAHQRLHARDPARLVHLGLVLQEELALHEGLAQVAFQRRTRGHRGLQARIEEAQRVLAGGLGLVHGDVGLLEQLARAFGVGAETGHADARGALVLVAFEPVGLGQCRQDLLADPARLHRDLLRHRAELLEHDHELVAAQARHGVDLAHAGHQAHRDLLQQHVALVVAQRVVERLEVVQVHAQQRTAGAVAHAAQQRLVQPVLQQLAVGQAGQAVVERQLLDLGLGLLALRDVGVDHQDGARLALLVAHQRPACFHLHGLALLAPARDLAVPLAAVHERVIGMAARGFVLEQQCGHGLAHDLRTAPAVQAFSTLVPVLHATRGVGHDDGVARLVQQRGLVADVFVGLAPVQLGGHAHREDAQRGRQKLLLAQRLGKCHEHQAGHAALRVEQAVPRIGLCADAGQPWIRRKLLGHPVGDQPEAGRHQLADPAASQRCVEVAQHLAVDHRTQRARHQAAAGLQCGDEAGLRTESVGHVERQLLEELRARAGRHRGRHLEHGRLHALLRLARQALLLARAQAHEAKGQVIGQRLEQRDLVVAGRRHLRQVQVEQAEGAGAIAQRQADQPAVAMGERAGGPDTAARVLRHVRHDQQLAAADRLAPGPLPRGRVGGPAQREAADVAAVADAGHRLHAVRLVVAREAGPGHGIAADVHRDAAQLL